MSNWRCLTHRSDDLFQRLLSGILKGRIRKIFVFSLAFSSPAANPKTRDVGSQAQQGEHRASEYPTWHNAGGSLCPRMAQTKPQWVRTQPAQHAGGAPCLGLQSAAQDITHVTTHRVSANIQLLGSFSFLELSSSIHAVLLSFLHSGMGVK